MSERPAVDELVVQFRGLRISITSDSDLPAAVSPTASSPAGSFTLVEAPTEGAQASSGPLAGEAASLPEELAEPSTSWLWLHLRSWRLFAWDLTAGWPVGLVQWVPGLLGPG